MIPYLSTFEQIQQEAQKLVNLKIKDIRCLDEEVVINLWCSFRAVAYQKAAFFASKYYFSGFSGKLYLFNSKGLIRSIGKCTRDGRIGLNPDLVFLQEVVLNEVILHELTHTLYSHHPIEFWQHLENLLYEEGIYHVKRNFVLKQVSGRLYLACEGIDLKDINIIGEYSPKKGIRGVQMLQIDKYQRMHWDYDRILELKKRVFYRTEICAYRKANNTTIIVDDNGEFIFTRPIWEKYMERYNISDVLQ
ncbi:MAG: DUF45 domain-containing protein, partial [Paludibacteraceae bacterium]|nr:DUF45 domain-containing protein [Paludibacteraceae bacterium]